MIGLFLGVQHKYPFPQFPVFYKRHLSIVYNISTICPCFSLSFGLYKYAPNCCSQIVNMYVQILESFQSLVHIKFISSRHIDAMFRNNVNVLNVKGLQRDVEVVFIVLCLIDELKRYEITNEWMLYKRIFSCFFLYIHILMLFIVSRWKLDLGPQHLLLAKKMAALFENSWCWRTSM